MRLVDLKEQVYAAAFCGKCLATALEALTGQGYINLFNAWTEARRWKMKFAEVQQWRSVT
jgi:hypothetical protein